MEVLRVEVEVLVNSILFLLILNPLASLLILLLLEEVPHFPDVVLALLDLLHKHFLLPGLLDQLVLHIDLSLSHLLLVLILHLLEVLLHVQVLSLDF